MLSPFIILPKSALADVCQFATGSNQLCCTQFSNKVEGVLEVQQRIANITLTQKCFLFSSVEELFDNVKTAGLSCLKQHNFSSIVDIEMKISTVV